LLRKVSLPAGISGELFLSPMPGRYRPLEKDLAEAKGKRIERLVCLVPERDITSKSPTYADALRSGALPWPVVQFPISESGLPASRDAFARLISCVAGYLDAGERILLHCVLGVGRTGMVAICTLIALGTSLEQAASLVRAAGSSPETHDQHRLVEWFAEKDCSDVAPGERPSL
jgi:protein-tyrosine phosphatase